MTWLRNISGEMKFVPTKDSAGEREPVAPMDIFNGSSKLPECYFKKLTKEQVDDFLGLNEKKKEKKTKKASKMVIIEPDKEEINNG